MKKKILGILFALVLVLSLSMITAVPATANDIASSTIVFEGELTDNGDGTFSGEIPAIVDGGFDIYAKEGASAWFGNDPGSGPVWTEEIISNHDAFLPNSLWDPDTPDWYQYGLRFYDEGGVQRWALYNHPGANAVDPWYNNPTAYPAKGVPMSGVMDWSSMYAMENDIGAYLPSTGIPEIPDGAAMYGGGPACWDMDWSWGSEVVPLQYPGFSVSIEDLDEDGYRVTLIPAATSGFVTGGGWIDSPEGAVGQHLDGTIVVSPMHMQGWGFFDDNGNGGVGEMMVGPGTPPLGTGSARLSVSDTSQGYALGTNTYDGTKLSDITSLGYSSYQPGPILAIALQFGIHYTADATGWQGRLVFEPYQNGAVTVGSGWQSWSPLDGKWWATGLPGKNDFPISSPALWTDILGMYPEATINGAVVFKAGSGWSSFDGNVDVFTIGINGANNTYDFEDDSGPVGKAIFGFVSKYKKGSSVPDGATEFVFKAADLNFRSNTYDWLVVNKADSRAQFKGSGTINGIGEYKFMLWAVDGNPDTFRIKIWYEIDGTEVIVYDNGTEQDIGGGSIVVHTKK